MKDSRINVKLTDNTHNHAGKACKKGDVISLRKDQAESLIKQGKGKQTNEAPNDSATE